MIDVALIYIRTVLDQYLSAQLGIEPGCVVLNGLSASDPARLEQNRNKVVLTLVSLEHENNKRFYGGGVQQDGQFNWVNPPQFFNMDMLVSANFDDYVEALKQLTLVVTFFQANLAFERSRYPGMPEGLSALKFEVENAPSQKAHDLWTALGVGYLPSMLYKVRHVAVQAGQVRGTAAAVGAVTGVAQP